MVKIFLKKKPRYETKFVAFDYQREAFLSVRDLDYAAIFHEQGLGKSKIAIDLSLYWLEKQIVDTVLIVAKRSLVANWGKEFNIHSYLKPKILTQNRRQNYYTFNSPCQVLFAHYEVILSEIERITLYLRSRDVAVILDESTKIKNPNSAIAQSFHEISPLFKKRVIMTGTPVANRPYDIWSQVMFLDGGKSLGSDFDEFRSKVDIRNDLEHIPESQIEFEGALENINTRISSFSVRELKTSGVIKLPDKIVETIMTEWEERQYELYSQIRDELKAVVVKEGNIIEDNSEVVLKRLLRLVQVASNPRLVDETYNNRPGKYDYLHDLISKIDYQQEKCIVWTTFKDNVNWLKEELSSYGTTKIHGDLSIDKRNRSIEEFLDDKNIRILIATPSSAKEGLTLTVANHVIFFDRSFSLDDYLQSQDRIHRISQHKTCYVYNLIMPNSIDEWISRLLDMKMLSAQLAQGDISLDYFHSQVSYDLGAILHNILGSTDNG